MPKIFEYRHRVAAEEIDALGHVNNQVYLAWMIAAAEGHTVAQGWPAERFLALGACWVVRRHEIDYRASAKLGDEVLVRTWVASVEHVRSERGYEMIRAADGKVLAAAKTMWAWIDMRTGRPCRIPQEVAAAYEVHAA
ncbi:MAG: thioesterase family protein [Elusimicrobiota bacterium]|jgi:acyl-CoA thioester hydrolase